MVAFKLSMLLLFSCAKFIVETRHFHGSRRPRANIGSLVRLFFVMINLENLIGGAQQAPTQCTDTHTNLRSHIFSSSPTNSDKSIILRKTEWQTVFPRCPSPLCKIGIRLKVSVVGADSRYAEGNGDSWVPPYPRPHENVVSVLLFFSLASPFSFPKRTSQIFQVSSCQWGRMC